MVSYTREPCQSFGISDLDKIFNKKVKDFNKNRLMPPQIKYGYKIMACLLLHKEKRDKLQLHS